MRLLIIFMFSLPVMAADWGRYANGYIAPPVLSEIQAIRIPNIHSYPAFVEPEKMLPNKSFKPSTTWIDKPPPSIGVNGKK